MGPTTGGAGAGIHWKGPRRRLDRRLEVAKAVGGGYCRLRMPLSLAIAVRETVAGHRLSALEGGGGARPPPPPSNASLRTGGPGGPFGWFPTAVVRLRAVSVQCRAPAGRRMGRHGAESQRACPIGSVGGGSTCNSGPNTAATQRRGEGGAWRHRQMGRGGVGGEGGGVLQVREQ